MTRLVSGGRSGGVGNRTRTVSGSGALFVLPRALGSGSSFSLRSGSNANLALAGSSISAASALAAGASQVALVRESVGTGTTARAVEYAVTLTGATAAPTPTPTPTPTPGTYLPASAALAGAYGLGLLVSAYAGPALRLRRVSDGAELDVGFSGQALDIAAASTFKGISTLTVAAVYDQTGNGRHLTQPATSAQPTLWLGEGGPIITNYDTDSPMLIPAALAIPRADCAVFMAARTPGQAATCGYWAFGGATTDYGLTSPRSAGNLAMQPMVAGASIPATATNARALGVNNLAVLGLVSSAAKQVVHRDGQTADYPAAAAATLNAGGEVGEAIEYGGRTDWRGFVVYSAAPTDSEVTAIKAALKAVFSTAEPATLSFLAGGDSIIFGTGGANNRTITAALHHRSAASVLYRNIGIAGHRLELGYTGFDTPSVAYLTPGVPNVYVSDYGHNDIKTNVTDAASALTAVEAMKGQARRMAAKLRAYGFDMVIWQEAYGDTTFTASQEAARDAWNAWLRSGALAEDGLPCFDAVDKVASDTAFILSDAETDAGRGMALGSNSSDGVHPNEVHAGTRADHLLATYAAIPFALKYVPVAGQQGLPYTGYTPRVVKGTAPYAFALAPGSAALPAGLVLDAGTGVISGMPTSAGTHSGIVLRVSDSLGATADAVFAISVAAAATIAVADQTESWNAADATSITVAMPAIVNAGDVLVAVMSIDAVPTVTWDHATAGAWTQRAQYVSNSNAHALAVFTRTADGTEGGKVLNVTLSGSQQAVTRVLRVTGATGAVEMGSYLRSASTSADPPAITPSWTGASLCIAVLALDGTATITSGPAGYSGLMTRASSTSGQSTNASAWKIASGTEDPGAFTISASGQWVAAAIAVQAS
ncbi:MULTISPECIES: putative Ig domain-containing protein [unclassified Novosphingobium]|uniref:GDSL-type esterase/lipase family protein n=1 Tax=unclassified Novosphingobium TaxID=2644732 RepID=UPI00135BB310|nr:MULTISPECIES: putative Ig domain-containing protein [unclassified Novosphingobium]